jgi:predicted aspartyl protease
MSKPIEHRAFTIVYEGIAEEISTPVQLEPIDTADKSLLGAQIEIEALWDTGATMTCIKPSLRDRLKLRQSELVESIIMSGIGGDVEADGTLVSIWLTSNFVIELCPVYIADFPGDEELLIGMDIITMGDFAVCNADGKTSFSFAVPPFPDRINLADRADSANKQNERAAPI